MFPLVVVDQAHVNRYAVLEPEHDAPVPGNPHAPLAPAIADQRMQTVPGQIHVRRLHSGVQVRQDATNPWDQRRWEAAGVPPLVQRQEPLVSDFDSLTVTRRMTRDTAQPRVPWVVTRAFF